MRFSVTVMGEDRAVEQIWANRISAAARGLIEINVLGAQDIEPEKFGQLIFIDGKADSTALSSMLGKIDRRGRAVFLILDEKMSLPEALNQGKVDDVLVWPFRPMELLGKIYRLQQITMWEEVNNLNASFAGLLGKLQEDVLLAERMQKGKLPVRFPEIKGFKVLSRYLAGMRSGGDHADLAESQDKGLISMVLSDSSSYGLSSNVLSVLMRVAMKLSADETRSSIETVKKIQEELLITLGEKDRLSLFYGVVSRKDYKLRYINLGASCAYYADPKGHFEILPSSGPAITRSSGIVSDTVQQERVLDPEGRLVLLSDGFIEVIGGSEATGALLNNYREREPADLLNELVFKVKEKFQDPDDMPAQDCTGIVFDVEARLIRLAPVN
ncbi:MAG: hypothetical protein A2Z97_09540 [Bdellovibrionales bacterium GWB1_52_6]|nr:MAG: hypothetical protein A2Z97_09540 [Bdellovibrionales bacterium GWB1_52_6]